MNAQQLLAKIESRGVVLRLAGDRLQFQPRDAVDGELLEDLRAHKRELLDLLRSRASVAGSMPGEVEPRRWPVSESELLAMRLSEFSKAGLVVEVFSEALDETVILASDNATVDPGERQVVYRAAELRELIGLDPETLRTVHEVKRVFGATIRPN
jgi:hypothetical protein